LAPVPDHKQQQQQQQQQINHMPKNNQKWTQALEEEDNLHWYWVDSLYSA
jgi:hypothetical protein